MDSERDILKGYPRYIIKDISTIAPKIAGAWGSPIYDLYVENLAILIRHVEYPDDSNKSIFQKVKNLGLSK
ncbi:hypothetical protein EI546_04235 [Aequorivita sp. H23M31]|uniref:Uncharacterized protein n=1 Tax=Aequorivita ciconiae TaxID=2494375 RepID=A0A410G130_9FLAO|nr:hypothetical protein [Aequorivita sp. H23M31]QAA80984.1 hypothetical protein EI546_04235 [Aequorivita sp. H23M31]